MRAAGVTSPVPTMGDVGREHACQRRSPGSETHPIPLAEQPECPRMTYLESGWQFGSHHFFTVESATIRHECAITDGMDHPLLLTGFVDIGCNTLQHDNAVALDNIDDLAFDVGEAFENKRCPDMRSEEHTSELQSLMRIS